MTVWTRNCRTPFHLEDWWAAWHSSEQRFCKNFTQLPTFVPGDKANISTKLTVLFNQKANVAFWQSLAKVLQKFTHNCPVCLVMYPSLNLSAEFARLVELIRRRHLSPPVTPGIPSQPSPLYTSWLYYPAFQVQRLSLDYVVHVCGSSATFPRDGARETDLSWWGQVLLGSKANQNLSKNV